MPPTARAALLIWLVPTLIALVAAWGLQSGRIRVPQDWNPWAPLRVDATPNLLTRFKLARASEDRAACRVALAQADMHLTPLDDWAAGENCAFENVVRIDRTSVAVGKPFSVAAEHFIAARERMDFPGRAGPHAIRAAPLIASFARLVRASGHDPIRSC